MRRLLGAAAVLLLAAAGAWADGGVFVRKVGAAAPQVRTPDQRALVVFDGRTETLVVETTVQGAGTEFAWVLPLPAAPTIEASTTGLLPTLHALCGVDLWIDETPWAVPIAGFGLVVGGWLLRRRRRTSAAAAAMIVGGAILLLAGLGFAGRDVHYGDGLSFGAKAAPGSVEATPVRVLSRDVVGAFDTAVLDADDAASLRAWLDANGFHAPPAIDAVAARYVADGWVFAASKVRADAAADDVRRIHPLAFTFPATEAVYPMRLTGAVNDTLDLELFVAAADRASREGLDRVSCEHFGDAARFTRHPEVLRRLGDARCVTRLRGTFDRAAMERDLRFHWDAPVHERPLYFTPGAAAAATASVVAGVLVLGLFVGIALGRRRAWPVVFVTLGVAAVAGAGTWAVLPKLPPPAPDDPDAPGWPSLAGGLDVDLSRARREVADAVRGRTNGSVGGPVREEDSPGNYVLTLGDDGGVELHAYHDRGFLAVPLSEFGPRVAGGPGVDLTGVVRDARGEPLGGATVEIRRGPTERRDDAPAVHVRADAAGRFTARLPRGFLCHAYVDAPGHATAVVERIDLRVAAPAPIEVAMADGSIVEGRVLEASGAPSAGARVGCRAGPRKREVVTDRDGAFRLDGLPAGDEIEVDVHPWHAGAQRCRATTRVVRRGTPCEIVLDR